MPVAELLATGRAAHDHKSSGEALSIAFPAGMLAIDGRPLDPQAAGACFVVDGQAATLRPPRWRKDYGTDPMPMISDIMLLHGINNAPTDGPPRMGIESEGAIVDPTTGETINDAGDPDETHPELYRFVLEGATPPVTTLREAGVAMYHNSLDLIDRARRAKGALYVGSNIAHRVLTLDDIHPHPYPPRMAEYMGAGDPHRTMEYFDGMSLQATIENMYPYPVIAPAINLATATITPLLARFTASSFAARGTVNPEYPAPYDAVRPADGFLQTRALGRRIGSDAQHRLLPTDPTDFLIMAHERILSHEIPGPGRVAALHGDIRLRIDHPPAGATEFCSMDTNGAHIESSIAFTALLRAYMYAVPKAYQTGQIEDLANRYPRLFKIQVAEHDLARAEANSIVLAQDLPETTIECLDGTTCTPEELWSEAINAIAELVEDTPFALSEGTKQWLRLRAQKPSEAGAEDVNAFFRGGPGVLAHYQKALYRRLRREDHDEPTAIALVQAHTARCFEDYIANFDPDRDLAFAGR